MRLNMQNKRVVITGVGVISSVGNDVSTFWDNLVNGRSGITTVTRLDLTNYKTKIGGEVKNFDISKYIHPKEAKRMDLFCHYAIAAADEAMKSANLPLDLTAQDSTVDADRVGVIVSSGIGGLGTMEEQHSVLLSEGPLRISPFMIPKMISDISSGLVSIRYHARGPNMGIVTACASSTHSIGEAMWMIKRGDADVMIAGGAEASLTTLGFSGFGALQALSTNNDNPTTASRPFDATRDGFVMAEGAGVVILESYEHAKARGAHILAELIGYGASGDAYHITSPTPGGEGAARAMKVAMQHANVKPEEIDYINAHGTSTQLNDKFETSAIKIALGEAAKTVSISSTKGTMGHSLGAAGALETIACICAIRDGVVPPTINYVNHDPECDLDITPNVAKKRNIKVAMNTNLGFGGHNAALIIKKFEN